ncbi:MAG TPA: hypothetical protein V6C86_22115 [Oculatellaceae cyanobacterium]
MIASEPVMDYKAKSFDVLINLIFPAKIDFVPVCRDRNENESDFHKFVDFGLVSLYEPPPLRVPWRV